jgi:hypothetical protein
MGVLLYVKCRAQPVYSFCAIPCYLRKIFQPTIEKVTGSRKKTVFCFLPQNIIIMIKRQVRWVTHVAYIGEVRKINSMEEPFKELGTDRRLHLKDLGMNYIQDRHHR